jgi:prepilin-type N-terminal cleavage/methylation domain-containing protein
MNNERGYTLAELLTAIAVMGLLLAGLLLTLQQGQTAYQYGARRAEVQQNARVALDRMLRELRSATTIITSTTTDVKFTYCDGTNPATTSCDSTMLVTVEYTLSGTPSAGSPVQLQRNQTGAANQPDILIGGVGALTITYYDVNNAVTTTAGNVRSVEIQITTVPEDTTLAAPNIRTAGVGGRVRVRNE